MAIRAVQGAVFQRLHSPHSDDPIGVELVLHHDVLCSWCYVADARLDYLRDEYGPALRWSLRPYPLRPENQIPYKKQRAVLARHFRRVGREQGGKGVPALVIGGEWLMQGCRELSEYREVIDKYLRERVAAAQVRTMH